MKRLLLCVLISLLASATPLHADTPEPDIGNLFLCGQHALAAEMRYQPFETLLEGARVLHTKGMCYRDNTWLNSWQRAGDVMRWDTNRCISDYACQGFFLFDTIEPRVREPIALAVHVALTEQPSIPRYHWDTASAPLVYWWFSPLACPSGFFVSGDLRIC